MLGAGSAVASIDGGRGSNSLTATAQATESITLDNALLNRSVASDVTLAGIGTATLVGGTGNNVLNGAAFTGNLTLQISGGTDTLTGNGTNTTVLAAAGGSSLTMDGSGSGTIGGGEAFSGVTAVSGDAGSDTFIFTATGSLSACSPASAATTPWTSRRSPARSRSTSRERSPASPILSISGITNVIGNGANTSFQGNNTTQTYTITNPDAFTVASQNYTGVGSIKGGTAGDTFVPGGRHAERHARRRWWRRRRHPRPLGARNGQLRAGERHRRQRQRHHGRIPQHRDARRQRQHLVAHRYQHRFDLRHHR